MLLVAPNVYTTSEGTMAMYDAETGRISLGAGGKVYGAGGAAAVLGMSVKTFIRQRERTGGVPGFVVPPSYLVTETALIEERARRGMTTPYAGPALPCAVAGPSGVLLTRKGAAALLGISIETLRRIPEVSLPVQRVAYLVLYRLEDIEARRGGRV